jgi:hypothetical protein
MDATKRKFVGLEVEHPDPRKLKLYGISTALPPD